MKTGVQHLAVTTATVRKHQYQVQPDRRCCPIFEIACQHFKFALYELHAALQGKPVHVCGPILRQSPRDVYHVAGLPQFFLQGDTDNKLLTLLDLDSVQYLRQLWQHNFSQCHL